MTPYHKAFTIDELMNAVDSLETAASFLDRADPYKWKWIAIALHHAMYGFCISAIAHGDPFCVLTNPSGKDDDGHLCERGGDRRWRRSRRMPVCDTPAYRICWEWTDPPLETQEEVEPFESRMNRLDNGKLIGFWTALARVQDPVLWMGRTSGAQPLCLSDEQVRRIAWLATKVRNELVHFVPKTNTIFIRGIQEASKDIINAIGFLVFQSKTIYALKEPIRDKVKASIVDFADYYEAQQDGGHVQ